MRAVRNEIDGITVAEVEAPEPGPNDVRVDIRAAGICGSDLEMVNFGPIAVTLGHEMAGVTADGTAVAVLPFVACGECDRCRAAQPQQCAKTGAAMYGVSRDGGMADAVWVDRSCLSPLAPNVAVADASLVEPLAVTLHAANRAGIQPGMRVAVVGAGTIGLCAAVVAQHLGADVALVARHAAQHQAAEALGVSREIGRGYDVVVEAAGTASSFDDSIGLCARGGTLALVSTTWSPIEVSFLRAQMREVTMIPAFGYGHAHEGREFDTAAAIHAARPEIGQALVTHRYGLDDAAEAFRVAADRAAGAIKVVLSP